MKPPICAICEERGRRPGEFRLIYFKKRETDKEWDKKAAQPGFTGHPPYAAWFCPRHFPEAGKLEHLTIGEALEQLREKFKNDN